MVANTLCSLSFTPKFRIDPSRHRDARGPAGFGQRRRAGSGKTILSAALDAAPDKSGRFARCSPKAVPRLLAGARVAGESPAADPSWKSIIAGAAWQTRDGDPGRPRWTV